MSLLCDGLRAAEVYINGVDERLHLQGSFKQGLGIVCAKLGDQRTVFLARLLRRDESNLSKYSIYRKETKFINFY